MEMSLGSWRLVLVISRLFITPLMFRLPTKQPPEMLCKKRCSWRFLKIHRCFPVNFRTRLGDCFYSYSVLRMISKVFANSWSSKLIFSWSTKLILADCEELSLKRGFMFFQKVLFSLISHDFRFEQHFFLSFLKNYCKTISAFYIYFYFLELSC